MMSKDSNAQQMPIVPLSPEEIGLVKWTLDFPVFGGGFIRADVYLSKEDYDAIQSRNDHIHAKFTPI